MGGGVTLLAFIFFSFVFNAGNKGDATGLRLPGARTCM